MRETKTKSMLLTNKKIRIARSYLTVSSMQPAVCSMQQLCRVDFTFKVKNSDVPKSLILLYILYFLEYVKQQVTMSKSKPIFRHPKVSKPKSEVTSVK